MSDDLIQQGKRDFFCGEYTKSVEQFQQACESLAKENGDDADCLAEPYLWYGTALIEVARMESGVLGNALEGVPEGDDEVDNEDLIEKEKSLTEEEKEKLSDDVIDAMCDQSTTKSSETPVDDQEAPRDIIVEANAEVSKETASEVVVTVSKESSETNDTKELETPKDVAETTDESEKEVSEEKAKEEDQKEVETPKDVAETTDESEKEVSEEKATEEDQKEDDNEAEDEDEDDEDGAPDDESEDVSNLQLAWEVIELSKSIFAKRGEESQHKLKVAECLVKLGEIGLEKEDYEQAINDFKQCLTIRESVLSSDDRRLAEIRYQLAAAYGASDQYEQSLEEFKKCQMVLQNCLEDFKQKLTVEGIEEAETTRLTSEIAQISDLLPDLKARISEASEDKMDHEHIKKVVREGLLGAMGDTTKLQGETSGADDITHLVRKKRKADEPEIETNGTTVVDTHNTNGTHTNGTNGTNGHVTTEETPVVKKIKLIDETTNGIEKEI